MKVNCSFAERRKKHVSEVKGSSVSSGKPITITIIILLLLLLLIIVNIVVFS